MWTEASLHSTQNSVFSYTITDNNGRDLGFFSLSIPLPSLSFYKIPPLNQVFSVHSFMESGLKVLKHIPFREAHKAGYLKSPRPTKTLPSRIFSERWATQAVTVGKQQTSLIQRKLLIKSGKKKIEWNYNISPFCYLGLENLFFFKYKCIPR